MTILNFTSRLGIALLLGAFIGIERQWRQKSAGLRTNTLVSLGSAAFILLSISITANTGDQSRIAAQIVTGIGFLGAGVIMKDGMSVHGLNTAATIWCSAAVGSLAGIGLFAEATIVTIAIMLTHLVLRPLGNKLSKLPYIKSDIAQTEYLFTIKCKEIVENHIRILLIQHLGNDDKLLMRSLTSSDNGDPNNAIITAEITSISPQDLLMEKVASRLTIERDVMKVKWEVVGAQTDV
ncbi:MgtC/SapB family protein [Ferruginibacter sp.]|uniref:MgtC/SapB family protein n=1 Tax=Ferruginibacter sp. TaxID=1940288 RepID=UPI00265894AB|nr:MgtC/SapB family protein [Ferruginibacter sp.]